MTTIKSALALLLLNSLIFSSCAQSLKDLKKQAEQKLQQTATTSGFTEEEAGKALKEALSKGATKGTELVSKANNRITIMPGGGLRSTNIETIQQNTKAVFYHSSAITDGSETAAASEVQALKSKLQ